MFAKKGGFKNIDTHTHTKHLVLEAQHKDHVYYGLIDFNTAVPCQSTASPLNCHKKAPEWWWRFGPQRKGAPGCVCKH